MLSPRLTNCPECSNIPDLLKKINCKLAELGNSLYNNVSYMLNQPIPAGDMLQLIAYRRILTHKYCNPNYVHEYSVAMIASRVIRITAGCVSRCNEPERCLEDPCEIDIVANPTTTSTTTAMMGCQSFILYNTATVAESFLIGNCDTGEPETLTLQGLCSVCISTIVSLNVSPNIVVINTDECTTTTTSTTLPPTTTTTSSSSTSTTTSSSTSTTTSSTTTAAPTTTTTTTAMVLPSVTVCGRTVTIENSNLTVLTDGTPIVYAADITEWNNYVTSSIPCYTYWQFDPAEAYRGCLYNQVAINNLAPPGWRGLTTQDVQYFYECNPYLPVENLYAAYPGNWDPTFWTDQSNAGETGINFQGYGSPLWNAGNILWNGDGRFEAHGYSPSTFPAYGCSVNTAVGYVSWGDYLGYTINDPLYARFIKL
jgi:hypothetical protein